EETTTGGVTANWEIPRRTHAFPPRDQTRHTRKGDERAREIELGESKTLAAPPAPRVSRTFQKLRSRPPQNLSPGGRNSAREGAAWIVGRQRWRRAGDGGSAWRWGI
uniref:Uncharacterized protein n=1 Tax=Leersia perrieri TaxID=77586 RepID=A0A0D9XJN2_9ORYZ